MDECELWFWIQQMTRTVAMTKEDLTGNPRFSSANRLGPVHELGRALFDLYRPLDWTVSMVVTTKMITHLSLIVRRSYRSYAC